MRYHGRGRGKRAGAVLAAMACVSVARAANPSIVRVGYFANITHATPIVGFCPQKQTYYKAFPGVDFSNRLFQNGSDAIAALRAGTLDMAFIGGGPAISAYGSAKDVVILANTASGGTLVVARKGSGIRTVADLKGHRVAVMQYGSGPDILLRYQIALNGLRPTDRGGKVPVVVAENANMVSMFRGGKVDAACVPEPWASRLERQTGANVVLTATQIFNNGNYPVTVLVARRDFLSRNRDFARRFAAVTNVITRAIADRPDQFVPILTSEMQRLSGQPFSDVEIRSAVARTRFTTRIDQHEVAVFANLVELAGYRTAGQSLDGILWR